MFAGHRRGAERTFWRLHALGIAHRVEPMLLELCEPTNLLRALERVQPDEVYHLAAQSHVGVSFEQPVYTFDVNATGTLRLLEALRQVRPDARLYHASTSEMFGQAGAEDALLHEDSPLRPRSPYAVAKVAAHHAVGLYREAWGLHASRGILFNHESELRDPAFVTRKISLAVARIAHGLQHELVLGTLEARRDWGYAPEYVDAMVRMVRAPSPDDFVVATGVAASVRDFAALAFRCAGVDLVWEGAGLQEVGRDAHSGAVRVRLDAAWVRPAEVGALRGDATRAHERLGWRPQTPLPDLVTRMVEADLRQVEATATSGPRWP